MDCDPRAHRAQQQGQRCPGGQTAAASQPRPPPPCSGTSCSLYTGPVPPTQHQVLCKLQLLSAVRVRPPGQFRQKPPDHTRYGPVTALGDGDATWSRESPGLLEPVPTGHCPTPESTQSWCARPWPAPAATTVPAPQPRPHGGRPCLSRQLGSCSCRARTERSIHSKAAESPLERPCRALAALGAGRCRGSPAGPRETARSRPLPGFPALILWVAVHWGPAAEPAGHGAKTPGWEVREGPRRERACGPNTGQALGCPQSRTVTTAPAPAARALLHGPLRLPGASRGVGRASSSRWTPLVWATRGTRDTEAEAAGARGGDGAVGRGSGCAHY